MQGPYLLESGSSGPGSRMTSCSGIIKVSYHALLFEPLLIYLHRNSMRKGLGLKYVPVQHHRLTYVIKKNSFHKLIRVIRIFLLKIFVVQCHPRNIFNIELFLNYGNMQCYNTT